MNSLPEYIASLVGKDITLLFTSGNSVYGDLEKVLLDDALVMRTGGGKIAICSTANLNAVFEGYVDFGDEDNDICSDQAGNAS